MNDLPEPTSHVFMSRRLRLNYNDWGNHGAPPLLLVHGGADHSRSWDWTAARLCHDWHVIAPDLRGHGDSEWSKDGNYDRTELIYDLAQLVHHLGYDEVSIVAHSLGAIVALRYAGIYPEKVRRLVAIEGAGVTPPKIRELWARPVDERFAQWIDSGRALSGKLPHRYATFEDALARMQSANRHLSAGQARHLTVHAIARNEDGSWSWKFDPYVRLVSPLDMPADDVRRLWGQIDCPVMLMWGAQSWSTHPSERGIADSFRDVRVVEFADSGHWLHHDEFEKFIAAVGDFL
jgi:pimeloyl-ACP methyl ester carboxylesterase